MWKFTAKERDAETGLDWFNTRYFSGAQGRFTSPDAPFGGLDFTDPQSLNRYAYGRNNPLKYTDPTGQNYTVCDTSGNCGDLTNQQYKDYLTSLTNTQTSVNSAGQISVQNDNGSSTLLGTATYYNEQKQQQDQQGIQMITNGAGPVVNFLGETLVAFILGPGTGALEPGMPESSPRHDYSPSPTGRTTPANLKEQLAMEQVKANPGAGNVVPLKNGMTDPRWPGSLGWQKMSQNVNGVEIHYIRNVNTGAVADFKFK